ncbi:polyisoprenoid-binding protein [Actinomadura craniellae]|uniref:Polyisoprenoid-binding protein n=1 Tax=Actinomadura craniellae TaxID=2231787 RepID=A0A365GWQ5_9ACTN|nr:YceI family protein [Actinomadura craniellae]RAY11255.1 polyisoprenoid-binding protein [Actinomadura craniellae]
MTTLADLGLTAGTWTIDATHSSVDFTVRHLMTKIRGQFTEFSGTVEIAEDLASSTATVEISAGSIDTRSADRDGHLRSGDFLEIEKYPVLKFAATGVREDGDDYLIDGELTIKDVTRPVTLKTEFNGVDTDPYNATKAGFSATTSIDRRDFGLTYNIPVQGDKLLIGDKISISLEVQAVRA